MAGGDWLQKQEASGGLMLLVKLCKVNVLVYIPFSGCIGNLDQAVKIPGRAGAAT